MKKNLSIISLRTDEIVQPSALQFILGGDDFGDIIIVTCQTHSCKTNKGNCVNNCCGVNDYDCITNACKINKKPVIIDPDNPPKPDCPKLV